MDDAELLKDRQRRPRGENGSPCARTLDDFTGILVAGLGAAWTAGTACVVRAGHWQAGDAPAAPDRDQNKLPPVHSGRNISTKENHNEVQQTRSEDSR